MALKNGWVVLVKISNMNFGQVFRRHGLELAERIGKGGFVLGLKGLSCVHLKGDIHKSPIDSLSSSSNHPPINKDLSFLS